MRKRAWTIEMRSRPRLDGLERLALAIRLVLECSSKDGCSEDVAEPDVARDVEEPIEEAIQ